MSGTDQYHEPPEELDEEVRNFARVATSLIEEADAINWYQQRLSVIEDEEVKELLRHAQEEEFEHFAMDLEWISRELPQLREILKEILFKEGNILENAEKAEEKIDH
ncbi:MAG: hypothetical protein ABEI53_03665 [Candidatus Magasanikbacteria bacterium]